MTDPSMGPGAWDVPPGPPPAFGGSAPRPPFLLLSLWLATAGIDGRTT